MPAPATPRDRAVNALIRSSIDDAARRAGVDRRRFLQGAGAVAASLAAFELAGCSSTAAPGRTARGAGRGGHFKTPPTTDTVACHEALSGPEFIFDVHTHHVIPGGPWVDNSPETTSLVLSMLPADCTDTDRLDCVDRGNYLHDLFLASDTTVAVLTDVPNSGPGNAPIPFPEALNTQKITAGLTQGGASRVLVENILSPNVGSVEATLEEMSAAAAAGPPAAFKVYTAWSPTGRGYSLEDPAIGLPTVQHAHDLGVKVFVAHKGLPLVNFDPAFNGPDDIVAISRQFRDMQFVVYHAAWDPSHVEGPYDPSATIGIDTLLSSLDRHGVPPDDNLWVDVATLWRQLLTQPDQAAHALGKLLHRVGEHRVLWGTDAIWYGSPEPQIMAMRAFEISSEFQDQYGYPALTDDVKAGLFGLNAADLFAVDPGATRCGLTADPLSANIQEAAQLREEGALPSAWTPNGPTTRRQILDWLASAATSWVPS
ncbi:MAG TPA: amidohydrolase family protein [Acidimicrobiales bacterium]|nr:amidohydrolase family protein [Acidimicrobiales bacterium]